MNEARNEKINEWINAETQAAMKDIVNWMAKFSIEPFINAPSFATLWPLDRKMLLNFQRNLTQDQDFGAYQSVMMAAGQRAMQRLLEELNDEKAQPLHNWRELADLCIRIANDTLTEVQRTPEFLDTQRRMSRQATDLRLQERELVETFCEAHHMPTRTEIDELQRTVHELRREVRSLQRSRNEVKEAQGVEEPLAHVDAPKISVPKKPTVKTSTKLRLVSKPAKATPVLKKSANAEKP